MVSQPNRMFQDWTFVKYWWDDFAQLWWQKNMILLSKWRCHQLCVRDKPYFWHGLFSIKNGDKSPQKILWHLGILARTPPNMSISKNLRKKSFWTIHILEIVIFLINPQQVPWDFSWKHRARKLPRDSFIPAITTFRAVGRSSNQGGERATSNVFDILIWVGLLNLSA